MRKTVVLTAMLGSLLNPRPAAEAGELSFRDCVHSYKPNPCIDSTPGWGLELARDHFRDAFEKARDKGVEVNLQDLHTVQDEPHRLTEWAKMAMRSAEDYV